MQTFCEFPSTWQVEPRRADGFVRATSPGADCYVEVDPLDLPTRERQQLPDPILGSTRSDAVRIGARSIGATKAGWRYELVEVAVVEDGRLVEARLVILLSFLERLGALRFGAADPSVLKTRHAEIMAMIESARPDWNGAEVVAIADFAT